MATYIKIATVTVGAGGAANIQFTSIPGTYTDLLLVSSLRDDNANLSDDGTLSLNGTNITFRQIYGFGSGSPTSANLAWVVRPIVGATATANTFGSQQFYIPNYSNTSYNKSISVDSVSENNGTEAFQSLGAGLLSSTAAVTSITIDNSTSNFVQYSTATLYGISKS